jgi:hypothetical protein
MSVRRPTLSHLLTTIPLPPGPPHTQAIHKQCFKERLKEQQAGGAAAQHAPARCRGKRSHAELDSSSPTPDEEAGLGGAAGAVAAAAGGGPAGSGTGGAAGTTAEVAGPNEVISQVYKALTVWPEPLRYLAEQAATTLLLPIADAEL